MFNTVGCFFILRNERTVLEEGEVIEAMLNVGFIGPIWMESTIKKCFSMFPSLHVSYRFSDNIYDAIHFAKELETEVDSFLFSSRATYLLVKENVSLQKESYYIPLKGNGFYKALYQLTRNHDIKVISIDGIAEEYFEPLEGLVFLHINKTSSLQQLEELYEIHVENYRTCQQVGVITSLKVIADRLTSLQIPVEWLKPAEEDIIVCLERLMLTTTKRKEWESQVIFGKLQINFLSESPLANAEKFDKKHKIEKLVSKFVDEINGYFMVNHDLEYVFISHRGEFERVTEGYKVLYLFSEIQKIQECMVNMGIGFGWTIQLANYHADLALVQSLQFKRNCAFIVNEVRKVIGPIELQTPVIYDLDDSATETKIKQLEIIKVYLRKNKISYFTAKEVATILNVTNRTANRLLAKWLDAHLIAIVGVEKVVQKGRPRQRYELKEEVK